MTERKIKPRPLEAVRDIEKQFIVPFLFFDNNAEEAANYYASVFKNSLVKSTTRYTEDAAKVSGMPKGSVMTVTFRIEGMDFAAINGGPVFHLNPAISFMVNCRTREKIDELWSKLSDGGNILMELGEYPFSERYGWVQDKFGVSWQLIMSSEHYILSPCLMFSGNQRGKAEEAINFYMSVFKNSSVERIEKYKEGEEGPAGTVAYASFNLICQNFKAMDSGVEVPFIFNPAVSFVVNCQNQQEIDYFWTKLTEGGDPKAQQCGWLADRYGVSWQIVPSNLNLWLSDPESEAGRNVMNALIPMKKLDFNVLKSVYDGSMTNDDSEIDFQEQGAHSFEAAENSYKKLAPNEEL
ncbi:MAG TPA: VOC family protein [Bacteroidales bacterium]|nr:VOC family protein [Bacteroidales bacterium]